MINSNTVPDLFGASVHGTDGDKIGTVGQVYLDDTTGQPSWVTVKTGLFGGSQSFVPVADGTFTDGELRVPFTKETVKDAPRIDDDGSLEADDEAALYDYYMGGDAAVGDHAARGDRAEGRDLSGPETDDAMTRSEEHLRVGTQNVETGRARLRKYVVTETETVTVPVSHEEVTLHREPITDANIADAESGPAISEEEHEIVLTGERVVTSTEAVPVERVRLDTATVTEQESVTGEVRKEQIELIDPDASETR